MYAGQFIGNKPHFKTGDPGRIRTCDPQIRNLVLYPTELRDRFILSLINHILTVTNLLCMSLEEVY